MIDPLVVYFTHAKISRSFSGCGSKIEETIGMIRSGHLQLEQLPIITVLQCKDHFFSLNNRRLYVLKELCNVGFLSSSHNMVKVRLKVAKEREKEKYTMERCSLTASFMKDDSSSVIGEKSGKIKGTMLLQPVEFSNNVVEKTPTKIIFSALSEKVRKAYKSILALAKKGKQKELLGLLNDLMASNDLSSAERDFISNEVLIDS